MGLAPGGMIGLAVLFLVGAEPDEGYRFPTRAAGGMTAGLAVRVADRGPAPGLAAVRLTVDVTGPPTLEVEVPPPTSSAWTWRPTASSWSLAAGRVTCCTTIELRQVRPGQVPLPSVRVRFRAGPRDGWEEAEWDDPLADLRPGTAPVPPPPAPPGWAGPWLLGTGLALTAVLIALALFRHRKRQPAVASLSPDQRALAELDRLEQAGLAEADGEEFHTQLSAIVRRYLAERFGVQAPQQTTAEFLSSAAAVPVLSPARRAVLAELLERCDLAKFARAGTGAEDCRRSAALARTFLTEPAPRAGSI